MGTCWHACVRFEETGDYDGALAAAHRSPELVPDNAAAIHVIAHVLR